MSSTPAARTPGVGDDQRLLHADALAFLGQQAHGAVVDVDLGQVQDAGHGVRASGGAGGPQYALAPDPLAAGDCPP
jgi:hypothetical protein